MKRRSRHMAKLRMGDAKDDIHVCIMCVRAIMNNKVSVDFPKFKTINVFLMIILLTLLFYCHFSMDSTW